MSRSAAYKFELCSQHHFPHKQKTPLPTTVNLSERHLHLPRRLHNALSQRLFRWGAPSTAGSACSTLTATDFGLPSIATRHPNNIPCHPKHSG